MSHAASEQTLADKLIHATAQIQIGDWYAHYKNPDRFYRVIDVALLEETEEPCVVYQADYGAHLTWIRPVSNWLEEKEIDGRYTPRFISVQKAAPNAHTA